jgi:hypothetical protein
MNSHPLTKKEWLKDQLDRMDKNEHIQILNIIRKYTDKVTKTQTGILISTDMLTDDCLEEIEKYVVFSMDQRKRMDEDVKTRKTYERMVAYEP